MKMLLTLFTCFVFTVVASAQKFKYLFSDKLKPKRNEILPNDKLHKNFKLKLDSFFVCSIVNVNPEIEISPIDNMPIKKCIAATVKMSAPQPDNGYKHNMPIKILGKKED